MYHALVPDLCDPLLLAETTIPSLYEAAGLEMGQLKITFDPTLAQRPLRIRPSDDAVFDKDAATRRVGELIEMIDDVAPPFRVSFLKADVHRPDVQPWPLDVMTTVAGLQLFYLRAQSCQELTGETLEVVASLTFLRNDGGKIRAMVDVYLPGEGKAPTEQTAAIREYCAAVQAFWNRLASTVVGHWCRDNGISELRLTANILIDPKQAMAAIGQPVVNGDDEAGQTLH